MKFYLTDGSALRTEARYYRVLTKEADFKEQKDNRGKWSGRT